MRSPLSSTHTISGSSLLYLDGFTDISKRRHSQLGSHAFSAFTMTTSTAPSTSNPGYSARLSSPLLISPQKKKTMSITQTYYLAHKARAKLSSEAAQPDHNLRLLVGHANLLDSLMLELAEAERGRESQFNQSVRGATKPQSKPSHLQSVQWAGTIMEVPEDDEEAVDASDDDSDAYYSSSSSDSDDESDDEGDVEMADAVPLRRVSRHPVTCLRRPRHVDAMDFEDDEYEDEDYARLNLTRSPAHPRSPPPDLADDDGSSEDEIMPPSPPNPPMQEFSEKQREAIVTTGFYGPISKRRDSERSSFYDQDYYLPERNPARLVSAISVH